MLDYGVNKVEHVLRHVPRHFERVRDSATCKSSNHTQSSRVCMCMFANVYHKIHVCVCMCMFANVYNMKYTSTGSW